MLISIFYLSGGHKPGHADEGGGAPRVPVSRHDTGQQFPAAVCGGRSVERGNRNKDLLSLFNYDFSPADISKVAHQREICSIYFLIFV